MESSFKRRGLRIESLERRQLLAAEVLRITVENLSDDTGLAQTPFWVAVHDGTFDVATAGQSASGFAGLELIAEEGDPSALAARFAAEGNGNSGVIAAPGGFAGAPVFEPGEVVTQDFTVDDTIQSQYFSFASMIIPSNDAFIGNLDPQAYRLFDSVGDFIGPRTIVVFGSQIWDAGTEVNDPLGGAAFAIAGGTATDENGAIALHTGLDDFVGAALPTGLTLGKAFGANTPIARITISTATSPTNPLDQNGPRVALVAGDLESRAPFHEISVVYSDPSGVDLSSIDVNNLRITGPLLNRLNVVSVQTDAVAGTVPREVTATYRVAPASGSFTALDNGTYSVVLLDNQVNDSFAQAVPTQLLGDFTVNAPVRLNVAFENLSDTGGLANTPVWIGVHNGNFEIARAGSPAGNFGGLEDLAEEGDVSALIARFASATAGHDAVIFAPSGFAGAPVFEPGEIVTQGLEIVDPTRNRFFSYASMVIPSNDAFIANLNPRQFELFDPFGNFTGARSITIYGQDIWDAGTEENIPTGGAAFSTEGGTAVDESGVIHRHAGLDNFIDTGLPTGETLGSAFRGMTPIGRITISLSDVPALPIDLKAPLATLDASALTGTGSPSHPLRVTYSDASGIDVSSIDINDIRVVGAFNEPLAIVSVTTDAAIGTTPHSVIATYEVAPLDGHPFTTLDNGQYSVSLVSGEVGDARGNEVSGGGLGTFEVLTAVELRITVENLSPDGGLSQTPFWIGVHEGNFEVARAGVSAANFGGLEALAEEGDVTGLVSRFATESAGFGGIVVAPGGFAGAPVIEPGEFGSHTLSILNTNVNRFFSFASMLIPSNDAFIANFNSREFELFDEMGFFRGPRTITLTGRDVYDAGTEVNLVGGGAAFSTVGGTAIDENGIIRRHTGLDEFIGTGLPTGTDLQSAFDPQTPLVRITIALNDGSSHPIDREGPVASLDSSSVTVAGTTEHTIHVTYHDPSGIDPTTIGIDDLRISGPLGKTLDVIGVIHDATPGTTPRSVVATYTLKTVDGQFTARDNGRYSIEIAPGSVGDTLGREAVQQSIGDVTVAVGVRLLVQLESLAPVTGLSQTPFWIGFHDGRFEVARSGVPASQFAGLELIAEEGDPSELIARFQSETNGTGAVLAAPGGFPGAPVIEPGETASRVIEVTNSQSNRFFSFASMVIPSNDAFVANRDSHRYELFDNHGNFNGARQITIYGRDILDAGTEVNDPTGGAAFSTEGGTSVDEGGLIRAHAGLDNFIGTGLPTGQVLGTAFEPLTAIATITLSLFDPESDACSGVIAACSARSVSLQNSQLSADVNRDGSVSALDSLLIINFLGRFGNQPTISDEAQSFGLDLDVGGDQSVSSLDALLVINFLQRESSRVSAEGESPERFDAAISSLVDQRWMHEDDEDEGIESLSRLF